MDLKGSLGTKKEERAGRRRKYATHEEGEDRAVGEEDNFSGPVFQGRREEGRKEKKKESRKFKRER